MENDLFQDNTTQTTNIEDIDHNNLQQTTNYLESLVGEGKKFKTVDDLARGKYQSDLFIDQLKNELKALREQVNSSKKVEDLISRLDTRTNRDDNQDHSDVIDRNNHETIPERTPPKEFDIDSLIEQKLSKRDQERIQKNNIDSVLKSLYESLGDNYVDVTKQRLAELGLSGQEFREYAAKNPKAALKLVSNVPDQRVQPNAPPQSRIVNYNSGNTKRNWDYYQNLRRTNPSVYKSDQIQMQMHNDAIAMGEDFYSK